jgi:hypothetical protein
MTVLTGCRRAQASARPAVAVAVDSPGAALPAAAVIGDRPVGTHGNGAAIVGPTTEASRWPDDVPVPSFGGGWYARSAAPSVPMSRPNWREREG